MSLTSRAYRPFQHPVTQINHIKTLLLSVLLINISSFCRADFSNTNNPFVNGDLNYTRPTAQVVNSSSSAQCVDVGKNPGWLSLTGPIGETNCIQSLYAIAKDVNPYINQPFVFYSQLAYPQGPGITGTPWKLPVGAQTMFAVGNCIVVIRMRRDFTTGVLPYYAGGYAPVGGAPAQVTTWGSIIREAEKLILTCVGGSVQRENAWGAVGDIIITLWPRGSPVDNLYGWSLAGTSDRNDTSNVTYIEAYASGTQTLESTRVALAPGESSTLSFASIVNAPTPTQSFSWGYGTGYDVGVQFGGNPGTNSGANVNSGSPGGKHKRGKKKKRGKRRRGRWDAEMRKRAGETVDDESDYDWEDDEDEEEHGDDVHQPSPDGHKGKEQQGTLVEEVLEVRNVAPPPAARPSRGRL